MSGAQAGGFIVFHPQTQTLEVAAAHGLPKTRLRDLLRVSSWDVISSALAKSGPLIALDDSGLVLNRACDTFGHPVLIPDS